MRMDMSYRGILAVLIQREKLCERGGGQGRPDIIERGESRDAREMPELLDSGEAVGADLLTPRDSTGHVLGHY